MRVLFGSQTGQAAYFASEFANAAAAKKWDVKIAELDEALGQAGSVGEILSSSDPLVVISSVYGEGVPPDNAKKFCAEIQQGPLPSNCPGTFAVFGLGDSRYAMERFNIVGRTLDVHLGKTGKSRLLEFKPGDAGGDLEQDFEDWSKQLLKLLGDGEASAPTVPDRVVLVDRSKVGSATFYCAEPNVVHDASNPFSAVCSSARSCLPESSWNQRPCAEVWLESPDLSYKTGDYFGVYPIQAPKHVEEVLRLWYVFCV